MSKKIFLIISMFLIILITGCSNKKEEGFSLEEGDIVVTCKSNNLGDAVIKMYSTVTSNFNKKKEIINYKVETREEYTDKKIFKERKKMYDETYKDQNNTEDSIVKYEVDEKNKKIIITSIIKNIDLDSYGEEEKKQYEISTYIKNYEKGAYKCQIKGISRKKLGLK